MSNKNKVFVFKLFTSQVSRSYDDYWEDTTYFDLSNLACEPLELDDKELDQLIHDVKLVNDSQKVYPKRNAFRYIVAVDGVADFKKELEEMRQEQLKIANTRAKQQEKLAEDKRKREEKKKAKELAKAEALLKAAGKQIL